MHEYTIHTTPRIYIFPLTKLKPPNIHPNYWGWTILNHIAKQADLEAQFHTLSMATDEDERSASWSSHFMPGVDPKHHWIGWLGPRYGLDLGGGGGSHCQKQKPQLFGPQSVTVLTELSQFQTQPAQRLNISDTDVTANKTTARVSAYVLSTSALWMPPGDIKEKQNNIPRKNYCKHCPRKHNNRLLIRKNINVRFQHKIHSRTLTYFSHS
jgi:hypothetical protein